MQTYYINAWLSIIIHLPHSDGDLPLADWQMFNNWGPKLKSHSGTQHRVNNKEWGLFQSGPIWKLVCLLYSTTHFKSAYSAADEVVGSCLTYRAACLTDKTS